MTTQILNTLGVGQAGLQAACEPKEARPTIMSEIDRMNACVAELHSKIDNLIVELEPYTLQEPPISTEAGKQSNIEVCCTALSYLRDGIQNIDNAITRLANLRERVGI